MAPHSSLRVGGIVPVRNVVPPNGNTSLAKDRRVVILKTPSETDPLFTYAVIATLRGREPGEFDIRIPSRPDGHPRTSLTNPSVVVCRWVQKCDESRFILDQPKRRGMCPAQITQEVNRTITLLNAAASRDGGPSSDS